MEPNSNNRESVIADALNKIQISKMSEKLQKEHQLALSMLKNIRFQPRNVNLTKLANSKESGNPNSNHDFNISDLVTDLTVEANMKSITPFEPTEMTGRSTLRNENENPDLLSIEDLLVTSCSESIRSMRDSLPRTADMSRDSKNSFWDITKMSGNNISIGQSDFDGTNNFRSGSVMHSALKDAEYEWENEKADIPNKQQVSFSTAENSVIENENLSSISNFFQKKSDGKMEILSVPSPKKKRKPEALIEPSPGGARSTDNSVEFINRALANIDAKNTSTDFILKQLLPKPKQDSKAILHDEIVTPNKNISSKTYDVTADNDVEVSRDTGVDTMNSRKRSRSSVGQSFTFESAQNKSANILRPSNTRERSTALANLNECPQNKEKENSFMLGALRAAYSSPLITTSPTTKSERRNHFSSKSNSPRQQSLPAFLHSANDDNDSTFSNQLGLQKYKSSLLNDNDDKFPIKANANSINWCSVKLRSTVEKSIKIRNCSQRRVILKMLICGPGFQLNSTEQNGFITLQSLECRNITCLFCPTVCGPAVGKLEFIITGNHKTRAISLFGYGGHARIQIDGVQHGSIGIAFLPLGNLHRLAQMKRLEKSFVITNTGSLPAFIYIDVEKKMRDLVAGIFSLQIQPRLSILAPGHKHEIRISYTPRPDEMNKLMRRNLKAIVIGYISIYYGDEITRHRIKNIISKEDDPENNAINKTLMNLCTTFPNENALDLSMLDENWKAINELITNIRTYEIEVTVNRNLDETLIDFASETDDESILFRTLLVPESSHRSETANTNWSSAHAKDKNTTSHNENELFLTDYTSQYIFSVSPSRLTFNINKDKLEILNVKNVSQSVQIFTVLCSHNNTFSFTPDEGHLSPGHEVDIKVRYDSDIFKYRSVPKPLCIRIYVENDVIEIPVIIH